MQVTILNGITYLTQLLVGVTFIAAICYLQLKNADHKIIIGILAVSAINEISLYFFANSNFPIKSSQSILLTIHQILWLTLLLKFWTKRVFNIFFTVITMFYLLDFIVIEKVNSISCYTIVIASLCYLIFFSVYALRLIQNENLEELYSDRFLLLCVPLLFCFGMSAILGFRSHPLSSTQVCGIELYKIVIFASNLVYYPLLLTYIYRQKKSYVV